MNLIAILEIGLARRDDEQFRRILFFLLFSRKIYTRNRLLSPIELGVSPESGHFDFLG
jgi:hypothetical protein